MKMKNALTVVAAIAAGLFTQVTFAQASAPAMRADVKAETTATKLTPAGQGVAPMEKASGPAHKTRKQRKDETKAAATDGKLTPAGQGAPSAASAAMTDTTRADRKAKTGEAVKSGQTTPAGQGPEAPKK